MYHTAAGVVIRVSVKDHPAGRQRSPAPGIHLGNRAANGASLLTAVPTLPTCLWHSSRSQGHERQGHGVAGHVADRAGAESPTNRGHATAHSALVGPHPVLADPQIPSRESWASVACLGRSGPVRPNRPVRPDGSSRPRADGPGLNLMIYKTRAKAVTGWCLVPIWSDVVKRGGHFPSSCRDSQDIVSSVGFSANSKYGGPCAYGLMLGLFMGVGRRGVRPGTVEGFVSFREMRKSVCNGCLGSAAVSLGWTLSSSSHRAGNLRFSVSSFDGRMWASPRPSAADLYFIFFFFFFGGVGGGRFSCLVDGVGPVMARERDFKISRHHPEPGPGRRSLVLEEIMARIVSVGHAWQNFL